MSTFYSPTGNPEVWDEKPEGYMTEEEWITSPSYFQSVWETFQEIIDQLLWEFVRKRHWSSVEMALSQRGTYEEDSQKVQSAYDSLWSAAISLEVGIKSGDISLAQAVSSLPELTWD